MKLPPPDVLTASGSVDLQTSDGISLNVRAAGLSDEDALIGFFNNVDAEDLRFRFGDTSHQVGESRVRPLLSGDPSSCVTFLAMMDDDSIVAASTLARIAATTSAEVALSVHASWKGRGIAWSLLEHTLAYATKHGFKEVKSFNSGDDRVAVNLEREMGFEARLVSASPIELSLTKAVASE